MLDSSFTFLLFVHNRLRCYPSSVQEEPLINADSFWRKLRPVITFRGRPTGWESILPARRAWRLKMIIAASHINPPVPLSPSTPPSPPSGSLQSLRLRVRALGVCLRRACGSLIFYNARRCGITPISSLQTPHASNVGTNGGKNCIREVSCFGCVHYNGIIV